MRHVIIGNGIAGVQAAEAIRSQDPNAKVTVLSRESGFPYSRPMISLYLEGRIGWETMHIRSEADFQAQNIAYHPQTSVEHIDASKREVHSSDGRTWPFDRLLIATGSDPRPMKVDGADLENIFPMRTKKHVHRMLEVVPNCKRALVLGGGLVGFKAAYGLLRRGVAVTMLISSPHSLAYQVDAYTGKLIDRTLRSHGLDLHTGRSVQAFSGSGRVRQAELDDGSSMECDLVVVGKGVHPCTQLAEQAGIQTDLGILVDDHLQTSHPGIYAAGDAAEHYDLARNQPWVNAIWPEAADQGRIAGLNMAGLTVHSPGSLSRNIIRIFDLDVMSAGLVNPPGDDPAYTVLQEKRASKRTYRKLVFHHDRLAGVVAVNAVENCGLLTAIIKQNRPWPGDKEELLDPGFGPHRLMESPLHMSF